MTSQALQLKREIIVKNVLTRIAEGDTIEQACENSGVAVSTFYEWRKRGVLDPFIQQIRMGMEMALAGKVQGKWGDVIELLLDDASNKDASMRDRDQRSRTLLHFLKAMNLLPSEDDEAQRGEPAASWLQRRAGEFPSVVVNVAGDVVGTKTTVSSDDEVVDGEVVQEGRRPGDYSPVQVRFPVAAVEEAA